MVKHDSLIDKLKIRFPRVDRLLTYPAGARPSAIYFYGALATFGLFYLYTNYLRFCIAEPFTYGLGMLFKLSIGDLIAKFFVFNYYPPLYPTFCDVATYLVGYDYLRVLAVNNLLLLPTALYVYLLFRKMSDSALAPFAAGLFLIYACYMYLVIPICIENLLMLTVAGYTYHIVASQRFLNAGHSLATGLWAAAGMLTKWTFPVYVLTATLIVAATLFYDFERRRFRAPKRRQWLDIGLALVVVAALAGWWYVMLLGVKYFFLTVHNSPSFLEYSAPLNLWYYFHEDLYRFHPEFVILALFFLVFFWMFRRPWLVAGVLLCVALPMFVLGLMIHIEDRYLFPLLPAYAFAAMFLAANFRVRAIGLVAAACAAYLALGAHFVIAGMAFIEVSYAGQSDAILQETMYKLGPLPEQRLFHLGLHPLWYNQHLRGEFYNYHLTRRRLTDKFRVEFYIPEAYNLFHRRLVTGLYDVVYLDCGRDNDCLNTRSDETMRTISESIAQPYVPLHDAPSYGSFDRERIEAGLDYLRKHYYEASSIVFGDGTYTRILVNRRTLPPAAGAGPP